MPVIMVNDQQYTLRPGANRLGGGADADVRVHVRVPVRVHVRVDVRVDVRAADSDSLGIQAIVDLAGNQQADIRRHGVGAVVRLNGVSLMDATSLMHGITGERRLDGDADLRFGGVKTIFRGRELPADTGPGPRAIAAIDRSKLRPTGVVTGPVPGVVAVSATQTSARRGGVGSGGVPGWVWGGSVVLLAIVAAVVFFLLNR